jgi:hypothetical protein
MIMGIRQLFSKSSDPDGERYLPPAFKPVLKATKIRVLHACSGSSDGIHVERFEAGKEYRVSAALAEALVNAELAEYV